jgi:acetylornithine deacetylase/succinyl-diaminopimelate desuccinylase-like protein
VDGHPKDGNLVTTLPSNDPKAPAVLLAYIDVVAANGEDLSRSPFKLVEASACCYSRGTSDDKAQAAIWPIP